MAETILEVQEYTIHDGELVKIYKENSAENTLMNDGTSVQYTIDNLKTGGDGGVPSGGTTGQVLAKKSDDDYDVEWIDDSGGHSGEIRKDDLSPELQDAISKAELLESDGTAPNSKLLDGKTADEIGSGGGNNSILTQIVQMIYNGENLATRHASEISAFPHNGRVSSWIQSRIKAGNYEGIYVNDYIPILMDGQEVRMSVAGIDPYRRFGDSEIEHHIDFISRNCIMFEHAWNTYAEFNNGTSENPSPWICSDFKKWLNSEKGNVATGLNTHVAVDYTTTGIFTKLPIDWQAVITPKYAQVPYRYTSGVLVNNDNMYGWENIGRMWIPFEVEVIGRSSFASFNGYSSSGMLQYKVFENESMRIKRNRESGERIDYWLASAAGNSTTSAVCVRPGGFPAIQTVRSAYWPVIGFRVG